MFVLTHVTLLPLINNFPIINYFLALAADSKEKEHFTTNFVVYQTPP